MWLEAGSPKGREDEYLEMARELQAFVDHPAAALLPNPAEVQSVHRIPVDEFLRADAPMLETLDGQPHPVLRMPVGRSWIAAPTAAVLYQFRELCLLGRATRVAHFEQPLFAWR